jgi:hypothetical protein
MTTTTLDLGRRYLVPVARLQLPTQPDDTHWSVYQWLPGFEAWATGPAICGYSTAQGPLPNGTAVTCQQCEERRPDYERYLAPGYRPEDDDPRVLRTRAEAAEGLLREFLEISGVTHKYPSAGGHDTIGVDGTCAGCELADRVRVFLEAGR